MIEFFVDGACKGNPGPGGFGVVSLRTPETTGVKQVEYSYRESCDNTTNNREEMKAILHVFKLIEDKPNSEPVIIYSDSAYCVNMINDWIWKWANNGWKNSKKQTVENLDLVLELYKYLTIDFFPCQVMKVKGHGGVMANELADALATKDKVKYQKILNEHNIVGCREF